MTSLGLDSLRARTDKACELTHAGRHAKLTELLRVLIPDLETAARSLSAAEQSQVFEPMASAYQACSTALGPRRGTPETMSLWDADVAACPDGGSGR